MRKFELQDSFREFFKNVAFQPQRRLENLDRYLEGLETIEDLINVAKTGEILRVKQFGRKSFFKLNDLLVSHGFETILPRERAAKIKRSRCEHCNGKGYK